MTSLEWKANNINKKRCLSLIPLSWFEKKKKKQATVTVQTDAYKLAFISTNGHARCRGTILLFSISLAYWMCVLR